MTDWTDVAKQMEEEKARRKQNEEFRTFKNRPFVPTARMFSSLF